MTLTQTLMIWGLRAVVLWGAAEFGLTLYDESLRELGSWVTIRDHPAAMERLRLRERELSGALRPLEARLAAQGQGAPKLNTQGYAGPEETITAVMRTDLTKFGAQGAQVTVAVTPLGTSLSHAVVDLTWDEPSASAPGLLASMVAKRPYLTVTRIKYTRIEGAPMVKGEAEVEVNLVVAKPSPK